MSVLETMIVDVGKQIEFLELTTVFFLSVQFEVLYGKKAAALYTQAGDYQKTARFYYKKAEDTYYQVMINSIFQALCPYMQQFLAFLFQSNRDRNNDIFIPRVYFVYVSCERLLTVRSAQANNWAAYDDWRRARDQWDYFYSRNR